MNTVKELIVDFLDTYATKVSEDEDEATTELYMDNHEYIEYEGDGYYIPEDTAYSDDESLLKVMIVNTFSL
jgi:hypothetical protein